MALPQLLVHHRKDNVGVVAVEDLAAGAEMLCVVVADDSEFALTAAEAAPLGHKLALCDLQKGDAVYKYGENIGKMIAPARKGGYVHVHNLKTNRW
ncbi:MAG: UxaA family hydrolase [Gammaproteobacteria bacterium]